MPPVKAWPESLINQAPKRLSCRHIIPCAGESGACAFYLRPVWPRSGRRQNNTPGWSWEDTASAYRAFFLALGSIISRQSCFQSRFNRQAPTAQNTGKGRQSTIYEAYSRDSPEEGRAFLARHSWRISLLPAFGSLRARSGSAPAAGRSFPPSPLLWKFQLEIHILFAGIVQHHHSVHRFCRFFSLKSPDMETRPSFKSAAATVFVIVFFLLEKNRFSFQSAKAQASFSQKKPFFPS